MSNDLSSVKKKLILGVGNDILMDDGIGPVIVKKLEKELERSDTVTFETINLGGLEILESIRNFDEVVIIDAIKTEEGKPGDLYILTPDDFKETCHLSSFHDISFLTSIKLGKKLNFKLPESIVIIAIEIIEDQCFGVKFSPSVASKFQHLYIEIRSFIEMFLSAGVSLSELLHYQTELDNR